MSLHLPDPPSRDLHHRVHGVCHDLRSARAWMARVCGPHELAHHGRRPLQFEHAGDVLGGLSTAIGCIGYGADVTVGIDAGAPLDCYSISLPLSGEQELRVDGRLLHSSPDQGVVVAPSVRQELSISGDCRKLLVAVDRGAMHATLESLLGRAVAEPLCFEPLVALDQAAASSWWRMVRLLWEDLGRPANLCGNPALALSLEESLLRGFLTFQPHNHSAELQAVTLRDLPPHVARLRDFIMRHAREDLQAAALVLAGGPSPARQAADFRRHLGQTPLQFLRQHRLQQVRMAIVRDAAVRQVSQIATDWGYTHLGRFARDYREAFGEAPSTTALRHRLRRLGH